MPGRGSYGPGGKWIYQRAKKLRAKNPDMEESTSFAIATQQAHKVNKSPKGFRTAEGVRTAKAKMRLPVKEYRKTAGVIMNEAMIMAFLDELDGIEKDAGWLRKTMLGLGMAGALAGGGKAMTGKALAAGAGKMARPAITQAVKKAPSSSRLMVGGATRQARQLRSMGVMP
jgi:hypothetical protein